MIESWDVKRGNKPEVSVYTHAYPTQKKLWFAKQDILFMTQAIHLDVVSLRVPTHANVFVAIGSDDVPLIGRQGEVCQERNVS